MDSIDPAENEPIEQGFHEQARAEVERLFKSARDKHGDSFQDQLGRDERLRAEIRKVFEEGRDRGLFPIVSEFLSEAPEERKEHFFKTGGNALLSFPTKEALLEDRYRLDQLRHLLKGQFEFETRYPAAYEILYPDRARGADRCGLYLSSFNVYILSNAPQATSFRRSQPRKEVDCWTATHRREVDRSWIRRGVWGVRPKDLNGILLAILSREEYNERIDPLLPTRGLNEYFKYVRVPHQSLIRITDLRLANVIDANKLKDLLIPLLENLGRPVNAESVAR